MAERYQFFDSDETLDRPVASADFARVFESVVGRDGIITGINSELAVSASSPAGMTVQVGLGSAWIQGRHYNLYSAAETLEIDAADDTNPRIDRIVVRLDLSAAARKISVAVVKGTPAAEPSPPTLTRDTETWELSLAQVLVEANATEIESGDITDERGDETLCGYVDTTDVLSGVRISEMGSNANGNYVRWANGLQICWLRVGDVMGLSVSTGAQWVRDPAAISYPAAFVSTPVVDVQGYVTTDTGTITGAQMSVFANTNSWDTISVRNLSSFTITRILGVSLFAIGRWKV